MATDTYGRLVEEDINVGTSTANVSNPGGGTIVGTQVSLSTFSVGQASTSATWDPGSIAAGSFESKDVTVSGAALGDFALASFSLDISDLHLSAQVTAANTVTVTLGNLTGSAVDLSSGTLKVLVFSTR